MQRTEPESLRRLRRERSRSLYAQLVHIIITLTVMGLLTGMVFSFHIPNPNMILITGLSVCTALYGYPSGIAGALVMILYSMYFFSTDHSFFSYTGLNLQKMATILFGVVLNVAFIGGLQQRNNRINQQLAEMNQLLQLDNDSLEDASTTDPLTGVRNRFGLRRDLAGVQGRDVHLMMLDLDDFKHINDHYGHAVGDYVLRHVGSVLSHVFGSEHCYRYGGDEFLVIIDREPDFAQRLERLKSGLMSLTLDGKPLNVHFSGGYVWGECRESGDVQLMLHQADHNIYRAKHMGKDRTEGSVFDPELAQALCLAEQSDG